MCKCHNVELGGLKEIVEDRIEVVIGNRKLADHMLTIWFKRTEEGQYRLMSSYSGFDDFNLEIDDPIRFCPFCGRKLTPEIGSGPYGLEDDEEEEL